MTSGLAFLIDLIYLNLFSSQFFVNIRGGEGKDYFFKSKEQIQFISHFKSTYGSAANNSCSLKEDSWENCKHFHRSISGGDNWMKLEEMWSEVPIKGNIQNDSSLWFPSFKMISTNPSKSWNTFLEELRSNKQIKLRHNTTAKIEDNVIIVVKTYLGTHLWSNLENYLPTILTTHHKKVSSSFYGS